MTIGKKLYWGFGAILAVILFLFVINIFTVMRQYTTRSAVASTLSDVQTIESVRYKMIENRLSLGNYLLSGDLRDEDKTNKGINELQDLLKTAEARANDAGLRSALSQVEENERSWADNFAKEMIAKRHSVDSGDTTVSDLQIFYLQHDPASWINRSAAILDEASQSVHKAQDDSNASSASTLLISNIVMTLGTLLGVLFGGFVAYYTAKSITEPLNHLIEVAHKIGSSGDLDQTIDIHRGDEVGLLADNFNTMIVHLKEMAGVSAAIAGGQLFVTVQPRSQQDTMAKARVGPPGARQRVASGQRCGPDGQRFRRISQGQRAGRFGDRRSHQHDA
jgi:nitrogen fixation/metabolism regulation signal transduction histidine kinase